MKPLFQIWTVSRWRLGVDSGSVYSSLYTPFQSPWTVKPDSHGVAFCLLCLLLTLDQRVNLDHSVAQPFQKKIDIDPNDISIFFALLPPGKAAPGQHCSSSPGSSLVSLQFCDNAVTQGPSVYVLDPDCLKTDRLSASSQLSNLGGTAFLCQDFTGDEDWGCFLLIGYWVY